VLILLLLQRSPNFTSQIGSRKYWSIATSPTSLFRLVEVVALRATGKVVAFQLQITRDGQEWNPEGPGHLQSYWNKMQQFLLGRFPPG